MFVVELAATAVTGDALANYVDGVRAYVACLRKAGVKVSDPDAKGHYTFDGDLASLKKDPSFTAAQEKCRDLLPPAPAGLDDKPAKTRQQIDAARQYATCMRAHGAPDFPDPGPDGYFDRGQTWDETTDGARRATVACASILGGAPDSEGRG